MKKEQEISKEEKSRENENISKKRNMFQIKNLISKRNTKKGRNTTKTRNAQKKEKLIKGRNRKKHETKTQSRNIDKHKDIKTTKQTFAKGKHVEKRNLKINSKAIAIQIVIIAIVIIIICIYNTNKKQETQNQKNEQEIETSIETSVEEIIEEEVIEETIDTEVEQLINEIKEKNNLNENNFYFFYYNLEEKKYYFYNANTYFTAASTIKVPVAMLYYDKIETGELSLSDTLMYNSGDYETGGGSTAVNYSVGERIPVSYLLEQTIVNSDNTALNILMHNIGYKKCKEELAKYSDIELPEDFYTSNIANVEYYYDVLQHLYQNSEKYTELIGYMKKSSGGMYLKANLPQYDVAHKYGSYNGYVHDYGIIYGQNTYLIGVLTKGIENASELIANIGEQVVTCVETEEPEGANSETEKDTNSTNVLETNETNATSISEIQESNMTNTSKKR